MCRCVWLTSVFVSSLIWQEPNLEESFPWKTNKTNGWQRKRGEEMRCQSFWWNAWLRDIKMHLEHSCQKAGVQELKCLVQRLLEEVVWWKSNRIALGKNWLRKYSLEQKILLGEEKKRELSPQRRTDSKNANLFQSSWAQRNLRTFGLDIQMRLEKMQAGSENQK